MVILIDKIWHDLWGNKGRTLQVVLIIAMGAFAVGMIIGTRDVVVSGMRELWQASSPATIYLATDPPINDTTLSALAHVEGAAEAEGFMQTAIEWRSSAADQWQGAVLTARVDYQHQKLAKLELDKGEWPQRTNFSIGQGVDTVYGIQLNSAVTIRVDDHEQVVTVRGVVYDPNVQPPVLADGCNSTPRAIPLPI